MDRVDQVDVVDAPAAVRSQPVRLSFMFFLLAQASGLWGVACSNVLKTHGLERIVPYVFACGSLAAIVSPLILGSLADQRISANRLLRWLATITALCLAVTATAVERGWGALTVLGLIQFQALWSAPLWGLATTIILAQLPDPQRQFGPIRVWATIGWMAAGWVTSFVLMADASTRAGYASSVLWLCVAAYTFTLAPVPPMAGGGRRDWRDVLGLRALTLLADRDHRVVFLGAAFFCVPLAAFFPFTAMHLGDLGVTRISAALSLGQISEIAAMYGLAGVLSRLRLKWVFLSGIGLGLIRYLIYALDSRPAVIVGIALHGLSYTLFFITAQIYVEKRVAPQMRGRAQALITLMTGGIGTFVGSIWGGWWRDLCRAGSPATHWPHFWMGQSALILGVLLFFAFCYRGGGIDGAGDGK